MGLGQSTVRAPPWLNSVRLSLARSLARLVELADRLFDVVDEIAE